MDDPLYVRIRGRVQGPFSHEKLRALVRRGQLGRIHELSKDGVAWQRASDFSGLFETPEMDAVLPAQTKETTEAPVQQPGRDKTESVRSKEAPTWYYAHGEEEFGPVDFTTLKSMVATGEISADDQVWTQGMANWAAAASIPGLVHESSSARAAGVAMAKGDSVASKETIGHDVVRTLGDSRSWVTFLAICAFLFAAGWIAFGMTLIIQGAQARQGIIVSTGLLTFICAGVCIAAGAFMAAYQSRIGSFVQSRSERRLEAALRVLRTFWVFISITLVVVLVFGTVTAVVYFGELNIR